MTLRWKDYLTTEEIGKLARNFCYEVSISAHWARNLSRDPIEKHVLRHMCSQLVDLGVGDEIPKERREVIFQERNTGMYLQVIDKDPPEEKINEWVFVTRSWGSKVFLEAVIRAIPQMSLIEPPSKNDSVTTQTDIEEIGNLIIENNGGLPDLPHVEHFSGTIEKRVGETLWRDVFRKAKLNGTWGSLNFKDGEAHSVHEDNFLQTEEGKQYYCFGVHFMTKPKEGARQWHACTPRSVRKWSSIFKHAEEEIAKFLLEV